MVVRRPRSEAACALPRPSASASAKLANSTVNHSQPGDTRRMKAAGCFGHRPGSSAPWSHSRRGEDAPDVDDEHHAGCATARAGFSLARQSRSTGRTSDAASRSSEQEQSRAVVQRRRRGAIGRLSMSTVFGRIDDAGARRARAGAHVGQRARPAARCRSAARRTAAHACGSVPGP